MRFSACSASLREWDHRDRPEHDCAALLVDLEERFAFETKGTPRFSRKGHSPVWAHGNYASHAKAVYLAASTWSNSPTDKLPLDRYANHPLDSPGYAEFRAHPKLSKDGRNIGGRVVPTAHEARSKRHNRSRLPHGDSHTLWMRTLRFEPQG